MSRDKMNSSESKSEVWEGARQKRPRSSRGRGDHRNGPMKEQRAREWEERRKEAFSSSSSSSFPFIRGRSRGRGRALSFSPTAVHRGTLEPVFEPQDNASARGRTPSSITVPAVPQHLPSSPEKGAKSRGTPSKPKMAAPSYRGRGGTYHPPPPRRTTWHSRGSSTSSHIMPSPVRPTNVITGEWATWDSLTVTISGVPSHVDTFTIWKSFQVHGTVDYIELFENSTGARENRGKVRFRPPPREEFWLHGNYVLQLEGGKSTLLKVVVEPRRFNNAIPSPVQPGVMYPASIEIPALSMDIGTLVGENALLPLRNVGTGRSEQVRFTLDLTRRDVLVFFQLPKFTTQTASARSQAQVHDYRLTIPFVEFSHILKIKDDETTSFVFSLDSPPMYHRRLQELAPTFRVEDNIWKSQDAWYRQTDIVHSQQEVARVPVNLRKGRPLINIGRWTTFRITFSNHELLKGAKFSTLCDIFKDYNIEIRETDDIKLVPNPHTAPVVWQWIDPPSTHTSKPTSSLEDLAEDDYIHLPFVVRYQLEVCISNGYLNEYTMGKEFVDRLASLEVKRAKNLLEHVATEKVVYQDPMKIFDIKFVTGATNGNIPKYCCFMRTARVTPSMIYYGTPSVDTSNRVVRQYIEYADRFLRVRFTDEKRIGQIYSAHNDTNNEVFTRIKRAMANGITVGGQHYEFLAFGNSQFREHGAYFFASLPNLTAANIRAWMGTFNDIKIIAKYAARLGQCFSTTRAVTGCPVQIKEIEDIERNGYTFSDGVGRISKFLAQMVMTEFKIQTPSGEPPSVFQFRLGGCKGILTVSSQALAREVHIRKSQYKFAAKHNGLEIIRHSQFAVATLNRQLIIVLSSLGIEDSVFIQKLRDMLANLELAMSDEARAIGLLQKYIDPNQMTLLLADMVQDGFQQSKEPFVTSLLELWRAWQIKYLKEKAKIAIEKGACLFGCLDETKTLKGYFNDKKPEKGLEYEERLNRLPQVFVQISRADEAGKYEIIEGPCILARNPSLHPGDIRVVRAVNVPELHHLKDVIVFPQTGDRDISNMCSGGDLDGDDYIVIWDQDLIPDDWCREPMDYSPPKAIELSRDVTVDDITSFFVNYIRNDRLPQIALAHLAQADYLDDGVNSQKCIKLAQLHSAAVDYNKSGVPAQMKRDLKPRKWPHFMEKKYKPKEAQYVSKKILGQLYDIVERVDFRPKLQEPFDERILNSGIHVSDKLFDVATDLKVQYDADMRRIMAQHEIKTEFEVWSTFVLSHAGASKDYKFHEELGHISTSLRDKFRALCYKAAGGKDFHSLAPLAIAMYKVTSVQMNAALEELASKHNERRPQATENAELPLISFPWLLQPVLGKIACRHYDAAGTTREPLDLQERQRFHGPKRVKNAELVSVGQDIEMPEGEVQRPGEVLELFHHSEPAVDPFSGLGDAFDRNSPQKRKSPRKQLNGTDVDGKVQQLSNYLIDVDLDDGDGDDTEETSAVDSSTESMPTQTEVSCNSPIIDDQYDTAKQLEKDEIGSKSAEEASTDEAEGNDENKPLAKEKDPEEDAALTNSKALSDEDLEEDIVELEGDVKPTAVDELAMLVGC